ncbi:MAG: MotA/TolQ/ExbB proton channel family protein [Hyphomicrobiales bacterium]|nr:MotA/TolQ/ExbB proton channel family protein [Hyphomicrobiales bacterium]
MADTAAKRVFSTIDATLPMSDGFGQRDTNNHLAWIAEASRTTKDDPYSFVLILRFALVNLLGFGLLAIAAMQGFVGQVMAADRTYLSAVIFIVFLGGLTICAWKMLRISRELNRVRNFDPLAPSKAAEYLAKIRGSRSAGRGVLADALRLKLSQNVAVIRQTAGSLVLLGLIGTVIGFIIALSGVDPETASDVSAVAPMISTLISGMSTALYTTLVGSILNIWLMVNYQLLASGTVKLITAIQEFGEQHARD